MKNQKILSTLDEIDIYMLNNLEDGDILRNPNDEEAIKFLRKMQEIEEQLNNNDTPEIIKNRFELTYNALKYATIRNSQKSNMYSTWIKEIQKVYNDLDNIKTDDALDLLALDCNTGHTPNVYALDHLNWQVGKMTEIQHQNFNICGKSMSDISSTYEQFLKKDTQALMVVQPKKSIFAKIKDFFKGKNRKPQINFENASVYDAAKAYRESQRVPANELKKDNNEQKKYEQQIIAVSDLHGDLDKWESVKKYMQKNPNSKVLILGYAMDRKDYGPEILLQIKELSDDGKAQYIPGNHDIFAYNYLKMRNNPNTSAYNMAKAHLERNGGTVTMQKLDSFNALVHKEMRNGNIKNNITIDELTEWLGRQPIQMKINENQIDYAIAHAIFDEKLYNTNPNFNLEKALELELNGGKESESYKRFLNCMWYRDEDHRTHHAELAFPENHVAVVGHTRQKDIKLGYVQGDPTKGKMIIDTGLGKFAGLNLTTREDIYFDEILQNER